MLPNHPQSTSASWLKKCLMFNVRCSSIGKDKGAVQISNYGRQTLLFALGKHGICQRATKLNYIFHIIVVNTTFPGWMYTCFTIQHTCKCISLLMWHAIIVLQSASLITSAIQWPSSNTNPGTRRGCKLVRHLPTTGISVLPYLEIFKPRKNSQS